MNILGKVLNTGNEVGEGSESGVPFDQANVAAASMAYGDAQMDLLSASKEQDTRDTAAAQLSMGMASASAVAAGNLDGDPLAQAISSTSVINAALTLGGSMTEAKALAAGNLSASDFFKKIYESAKEAAKKMWEYIRNLINKAIDFIANIFGAGGASGKKLVEKLKSIKAAGKVNLGGREFSEATQKTLAAKYPALVGADLDYSGIGKLITEQDTMVKDVPEKIDLMLGGEFKTYKDANFKDEATGVAEIKRLIEDAATKTGGLVLDTEVSDLSDMFEESDIEDKLGEGYAEADVELLGRTTKKIYLLAKVYSEDIADIATEVKDVTEIDKASALVKRVIGCVKYMNITITIKDTEALDAADKIKPIVFADCMSIAKSLETAGKKIDKNLKDTAKVIDKVEKEVSKEIDKLEKEFSVSPMDDATRKLGEAALTVRNHMQKMLIESAKGHSVAATAMGAELAASPFETIINESTRLMKK